MALRDFLSAPFPSDLCADPVGGGAAWVFNQEGCRNIWVAEPGKPARPITPYRGDEGLALGQLHWVSALDAVLHIRAAEIWLAWLDGSPPRRICAGDGAAVSPAGDRVAFIREGQIWLASLDGAVAAEPLVHARGTAGSLAWSPDGQRLAFVSNRGDYGFVGVYDFPAESLRWLSPGIDRDKAPTWSPDSREVAFIRLRESPDPTYMTRSSGKPWSIWIGDAATGEARHVWTAEAGAGSVFTPLSSGPHLVWTRGNRIVFPWEGSGWLHLHAVPAAGGPAEDLTPGSFEVFGMVLDSHKDALVYSANKNDLDRRHLWRTDQAASLTSGDSIEDCPAITGTGQLVALQADARTPLRPVLVGAGPLAAEALPATFPSSALVTPETVTFPAPDGLEIHAQLFLPPGRARHPAIVHFHGGPARQMLPAWHPMETYHLQYGLNQYLAHRGYAVLSVNYRGGTGYGLAFREPADFGAGGASEYQDALGAADYLRSRADIDPGRIGVYGHSYGGLMTALALARASDLFAAGVDYAGVANWTPAFPAELADIAWKSSPLADLGRWRSPALFAHADGDSEVPFSQTSEIVKALRAKGDVEIELLVLPDEQHDLQLRASCERLFQATVDFFDRKLV